MVVGENNREQDIPVNVCKTKQLTNIRAAGSDEAVRLEPPRLLSLDQAIEWLGEDEYLEITPKTVRIRKKYLTTAAKSAAEKAARVAAAR
jgi:GTP-binding protein